MASENIIMEMVKSGADRQVKFRLQLEFYLYPHLSLSLSRNVMSRYVFSHKKQELKLKSMEEKMIL